MSDKKEKTEEKKVLRKARVPKSEKKVAEPKQSGHTFTQNPLELLITIVSRKKAEYYADLIQSFEVNLQTTAFGRGTADAKMLDLLGLTDSEKAVIFSVIQENKIKEAMHTLDEKFKTIKDGKGVAFTVPLTSVIGTLIFRFLSNNRMTVKEEKQ